MTRKRNTAERIVFEFEHNVTEAHRRAIETTLGIEPEQFDASIGRARELGMGCDPPLRLTPIYRATDGERFVGTGWWTCRPTDRLRALAEKESLIRNLREQERNAQVLAGTKLEEFARYAAAGLSGTFDAYMKHHQHLLLISEQADYVIAAVDDAFPRLFVTRDHRGQVAA